MTKNLFQISTVFLLLASFAVQSFGQTRVCKSSALAALKPLPKLKYKCNEDLTESENAVLSQPNRLKAINLYTKSLEKLASADWWKTSVEDLNVCDFRKKAGVLSKEETERYKGGEYFFRLRGNNQFRVIIAEDPCYQQGFNGSNIFLLNRVGGKVFASEIIDGFYTRADFPLGFGYALNGTEPIIEIATTSGGLHPTETYYYFTIDKKTKRAVPKNLFKDGDDKMTNKIYSRMLLEEAESYGLPPNAEALQIIKNGRLAEKFDIFIDSGETFGADNHEKFTKQTLRWNGKFYQ